MGWLILFLVLIALAFGVLGAVIKATVFIVLTLISVILVLSLIAWFALRHQLNKISESFQRKP